MKKGTAIIYILAGAASFGLTSPITKMAYATHYTPQEITASQTSIGLVGFLFIILFNWKLFCRINSKKIIKLILFGIISGLTPILINLSLELLPASLTVVFLFQFTWMGIVVEAVIKKQILRKNQVIGLCFIMMGTIFAVSLSLNSLHSLNGLGVLFGILAACSYTLFLHSTSNEATNVNPLIRSSCQMIGQAAIVFLVFPPTFVWTYSIHSSIYLYGIVLGLLGFIFPLFLFMKASPHVGTGMTGILGSIELPVVVLGSYLFLGEVVHFWQWLGIFLMVVGIIVSQKNWGETARKGQFLENKKASV